MNIDLCPVTPAPVLPEVVRFLKNAWSVPVPMPVLPSGVSGISACRFQNCQSFDKLSFEFSTSSRKKLPPICRHAHSFQILSWTSAS